MSEFVQYLAEVFERFGPIETRRMFGGHGVYHNGTMFGLVAGDVLYLKAGPETSGYFKERGLRPFEYLRGGRPVNLSYYQAPEEIFDDPDVARTWAQRAYASAMGAKNLKQGDQQTKRRALRKGR